MWKIRQLRGREAGTAVPGAVDTYVRCPSATASAGISFVEKGDLHYATFGDKRTVLSIFVRGLIERPWGRAGWVRLLVRGYLSGTETA